VAQPWKLLVYLAGDNTLYSNAQISFHEIVASTFDSSIETIVQIDGPSAQLSTRYRCAQGTKEVIWEAPDGYTSDRSIRLTDFLKASITAPIEPKRIFLVLWGHGAGLDHVYFYDNPSQNGAPASAPVAKPRAQAAPATAAQTNPIHFTAHEVLNGGNANRYVSDVSLARILDGVARSIGRKVDVVGFDACMMAMAEVIYEMRNSTSVVVASDEEVPAGSWPYAAILADLARCSGMDAGTLSTAIVGRYLEQYSTRGPTERVSLSAFDLDGCGSLAVGMTNLVNTLSPSVADGVIRRKVLRARDSSRTPDMVTYIDLGVFCRELTESFDKSHPAYQAAQDVLQALVDSPYLTYHRDFDQGDAFDAFGAAIYFPEKLSPSGRDLQEVAAANNQAVGHAVPDGPIVAGKKFPPGGDKFPPGGDKFPPGGDKFPPGGDKFPPGGDKFPPGGDKFPPGGDKFPPGGDKFSGGGPQISGYEILWDRYVELEFNHATGWSDFIEKVIAAGY
jgi:hypothetical protein